MPEEGRDQSHEQAHGAYGPTVTARLMRSINRSTILSFVRHNSPVSRAEIARSLGMSLPTVMRVVQGLLDENLVQETGTGKSTGGRPGTLVSFNGGAHAVIAVDLGGTKTLAAVSDLSGNVIEQFYSPHAGDQAGSLDRLIDLISRLLQVERPAEQRLRGIGLGVPSVVLNPEGIVNWAPGLGWRALPLKRILSEHFRMPVFLDNDVNLAALGEFTFGAGRGAGSLICFAIGTGIGAGIVIDGCIYRGRHQAAGEVGYMLPGVQYLGRRYDGFGALESLASGTGIADRARQLLRAQGQAAQAEAVAAEQVFAAARQGAPWAKQVVDETVDYLALAIANASMLLDPEVVVLAGGVAQSADLLTEPIARRLEGIVPFAPRVVASPLGRRATVMGAISLVMECTVEHLTVSRFV
ncbi:MAG: ROK family transcriptional regulator [Anaerolineae bacterium]